MNECFMTEKTGQLIDRRCPVSFFYSVSRQGPHPISPGLD
ncbi:hypothetical protein QY97_01994 [Bacillus thermotolerans]|nr:hypothetical protein QY97_01994 [Bacillus thermotolerans]